MRHQTNTKVLVVDDDAPSRELFCEALASAGYAVRAASDGLNALRHMEETQFDVVLTDVSMPQMDGLELLTKIRDRWPDSRVVVHSNLLTWRGHMPASPSPTTSISSSRQ